MFESPSVWREWIEIALIRSPESLPTSPSVWREWIEIAESDADKPKAVSLPPCGGSGLK